MIRFLAWLLPIALALLPFSARAGDDCDGMTAWDPLSNMCMPVPMPGMPMKMLMLHGNLFAAHVEEQGPRGRDAWAAPNMVMADAGRSVGESQYVSVDLMLTGEKWVFPGRGYPLFTQIGERDNQGSPFVDAQHPHSSPIMGATLSDTIRLGENNTYLRAFFAPRGEATDGPIAFMHRDTGMVNPDAPLGHHIGQDVGHISSTVVGASLRLQDSWIELSGYHGAEPDPEKVDLPLGTPDSVSLRFVHELSPALTAMISAARVNAPEPDDPDIKFENRYSGSLYLTQELGESWTFRDSLIYGAVTHYDHASLLNSFAEEFLFDGGAARIWGRVEVLQRTASELLIPNTQEANGARWVTAFTLGYTHQLLALGEADLGLGGSATRTLLPSDFRPAYGGNPWSAKVFLELSGMKMWDL